ncbi:hypothetical protein C3L33_05779, partial [Rhododendron williamsianum]
MAPTKPHQTPCPKPKLVQIQALVPGLETEIPRALLDHGRLHRVHSHGALHRPERHQPLDDDLTIPSNHLHNFEHSTISLTFFLYAAFAIVFDKVAPKRLNSPSPSSSARPPSASSSSSSTSTPPTTWGSKANTTFYSNLSISIVSIGLWLAVMGFMLWTPEFIPKGCFMNLEEGHKVVRCHDDEALDRAKSLVNIEFSCRIPNVVQVRIGDEDEEEEGGDDVEAQKKINAGTSKSFVQMGKGFAAMDIER